MIFSVICENKNSFQSTPQTIVVQKSDAAAIQNLQNQIQLLRKQQNDLINAEASARKKLQESQEALHRKIATATANGQK